MSRASRLGALDQSSPRSRSGAPIGEVLPRVLKDLCTDPRPSQEAMEEAWKRLVGEEAARHSWPRRLTRGRLLVEVENSAWIYTLSLKKNRLLQGLIELLGAGRVRDLAFRIGEKETHA